MVRGDERYGDLSPTVLLAPGVTCSSPCLGGMLPLVSGFSMDTTLSARILVCVVLFASALYAQTPPGEKIYVGVLDDAREEMVNWTPGVAQERVVRPVFEKTASG